MEAIVYTATFIIYDLVLFCPTAFLGSRQQQTAADSIGHQQTHDMIPSCSGHTVLTGRTLPAVSM